MTTEEDGGQSLSASYFFQMWLSHDSTIIAVLYTRLIVVTMSRLSMMQDDDIRVNQFLKNLDNIVLLDTLMGFGTPIAGNTGTDIHLSEKDFLSSFPASAAPFKNWSHKTSELPCFLFRLIITSISFFLT